MMTQGLVLREAPRRPATGAGQTPATVRLAAFLGHKPVILAYNLLVLAALAALLFAYFEGGLAALFPEELRGLPLYAVWFGALGGIVYSLKWVNTPGPEGEGVWYYSRPFSGAIVGGMTFVLLQALTPGATLSAPIVEAAAFIVGIQERRFFELLFRVADVILSVPSETPRDSESAAVEKARHSEAASQAAGTARD
jgi:hypothetical protein